LRAPSIPVTIRMLISAPLKQLSALSRQLSALSCWVQVLG